MREGHASGGVSLVDATQPTLAQVYDENVDAVYRYVHRRCQDHALAEDVTQDTFMAAIRSADDPSRITTGWLITIARNRLIDVLRRKTKYEEKLRLVAPNSIMVDEVDVTERLRLESALGTLPVHYRLVLTLHYINGMTARAIAEELDQTLKSVEGLVHRARRELVSVLEADEAQTREGGSA